MRIAQAYFAAGRLYEAFWTFWKIYEDYPNGKLAEDSCYGAFGLAAQLEQDTKAKEAGLKYLSSFPDGKQWEDVSLQLGQIFIRNREYATAIDYYNRILEERPEHAYKDQILYMLGFSQFQDARFAEARQTFQTLGRDFPSSDRASSGLYWVGMTYLFEDNYKDALEPSIVLPRRPPTPSSIRTPVSGRRCASTDSKTIPRRLKASRDSSKSFLPTRSRPEAHTLLADCYGAIGELDKALDHYKQVEDCAVKQSQIDYAALQIGRIYEQLEQFKEMEDWFTRYLDKYALKGDYTQAIYRKGFAQQAQGQSREAIDTYWQAIEKFGNDPKAMGIDIIIDAYCEESGSVPGVQALEIIRSAALTAEQQKERTRALRFQRALAKLDPNTTAPVLTAEDIPLASPAVLLWMADVLAQTNPSLGESAARAAIDNFGPTQWTGEAFLKLGNFAFDRRDWKQAESGFSKAIKTSPMNEVAARATMRLGDVKRTQGHFDEAAKRYGEVSASQGMERRALAGSPLRHRRMPPRARQGKGSLRLLSTDLRPLSPL